MAELIKLGDYARRLGKRPETANMRAQRGAFKTAVKVKDVFERAKGHLLFIDEAYSLAIENNGSFGDEAITFSRRSMPPT